MLVESHSCRQQTDARKNNIILHRSVTAVHVTFILAMCIFLWKRNLCSVKHQTFLHFQFDMPI